MKIPKLNPTDRIREFNAYSQEEIDDVVYNYLFEGLSHRKLDSSVLNLDSDSSNGYQSMGILHYIGLRVEFKGIFKEFTETDAIQELKNLNDESYNWLIECIQRNLTNCNSNGNYGSGEIINDEGVLENNSNVEQNLGLPEITIELSDANSGEESFNLFDYENLCFLGTQQIIEGKKQKEVNDKRGTGKGRSGKVGGYGSMKINLNDLDKLGMDITIGHETNIRCIPREFIIDVSTPEIIKEMYINNNNFKRVFDYLTDINGKYKISCDYLGFDILILNPLFDFTKTIDEQAIDRFIELKSSGVTSSKQSMTLNELNSAKNSWIKDKYYLYLVENLRSDILNNIPSIKIINNPVENIPYKMVEQKLVRVKIDIPTQYFNSSEEIKLGIK